MDIIRLSARLRYWLSIHLHVFAFLGIMHFPLLYYFVRIPYGTDETFLAVKIFQVEAFFIGVLGILEKVRKRIWNLNVPKLGFAYVILVTVSGLVLEFQTYLLIAVLIILFLMFYFEHRSRKIN